MYLLMFEKLVARVSGHQFFVKTLMVEQNGFKNLLVTSTNFAEDLQKLRSVGLVVKSVLVFYARLVSG